MKTESPKHEQAPAPSDKDVMVGQVLTTLPSGEKEGLAGHTNYHGIDTTQVQPGADAAYEAKISVMNEALIDIGMGPFQWKVFAMTGFGWFVDNVSLVFGDSSYEPI